MNFDTRLKKLETSGSGMQIAMLLPFETGLNDNTRLFRWNVDGKPHGEIITVDVHRDEEQGESWLTGRTVWSDTRHQLPSNTSALMYGAHQL